MKKRECGTCTLCCLLPQVPGVGKEVNKYCPFCTHHCTIYENRPSECDRFDCTWLVDETVPDELKPEKCNVIFEVITEELQICLVHFQYPTAWMEKPVRDHIKRLNEKNISVIVTSYTSSPKYVFEAPGKTEQEVWNIALGELKK